MKVLVSKVIWDAYHENGKNIDYSVQSMIGGLDPNSCVETINGIIELKIQGEKVEVELSDGIVKEIKELLQVSELRNEVIEALLWTAVLFPEI